MKVKSKICKGNGLAKGYGCGDLTMHRVYGLCKMKCYPNWLLNSENGKIKLNKSLIQGSKKAKREQRVKDKKVLDSFKSIRRLINDARTPFQKWIRLRDINKACVSCGSTTSEIWDAGHYKKAEVYTGLIFNENNVHKQCRKCNSFLDGNEANYRVGLEKRIGYKALQEIEEKADSLRQHIFERQELIDIKKHYQQLLKEIR